MKINIVRWDTGEMIYETDAESLGDAVIAAIVHNCNLFRASLDGASLELINIERNVLEQLVAVRTILPDGELIGWKKLQNGVLCKLHIPAEAKRVGGLIGRMLARHSFFHHSRGG